MKIENYTKRDVTFSLWVANLYAILIAIPIFVILYFTYYFIWGKLVIPFHFPYWAFYLFGVVLHELIHGIFAIKFSSNGIKSVRFGITWKLLTPYCHCKEALSVKKYRIVLLSPLFILGILPLIIGLLLNHHGVYFFGMLFTIAAGGDLLIFWKLRKENENTLVLDSPDKCGCEIYEAQSPILE